MRQRRGKTQNSEEYQANADTRAKAKRPAVSPPLALLAYHEAAVSRSIQEVAIRFDEGREIQRVLAREPLRQLGIALLERLDDAQMVDDRTRRAVALRDRHPANGPYVDEDVLDRIENDLRLRQLDNRLMERDVRVRVLGNVLGGRRVLEIVAHMAAVCDLLVRGVQRG